MAIAQVIKRSSAVSYGLYTDMTDGLYTDTASDARTGVTSPSAMRTAETSTATQQKNINQLQQASGQHSDMR